MSQLLLLQYDNVRARGPRDEFALLTGARRDVDCFPWPRVTAGGTRYGGTRAGSSQMTRARLSAEQWTARAAIGLVALIIDAAGAAARRRRLFSITCSLYAISL